MSRKHLPYLFAFAVLFSCNVYAFASSDDSPLSGLELTQEESTWLNQHPVIRISIMSNWPPMNYVDEFGHPRGLGVDYLTAINTRLRGRISIVPNPFKEGMALVKEKALDALMDITPKKEREPYFNFTRPYLVIPHVIVGRKNGPYFRTEADLNDKSVALEAGFYNVKYFRGTYPGIRIREYGSTSLALGAVARGEADAYAGNRAVVIYLMEKELMTNLQIQGRLNKPPVVLAIGVRKDWPELVSILNKAFSAITLEEERRIRQGWIGSPVATLKPLTLTPKAEFNEMQFVLKGILTVFVVILVLAFLTWLKKGRPKSLSLNATLFAVSLVFTGMIVAICTFVLLLLQLEKKLADIEMKKYESLRLAYELKQSSDDLTRFARTFAVTGEFRFEAYYHDIIAIRNGERGHPGTRVPSYWDHVAAGTMNLDESGEIYSIEERMKTLGLSADEQALLAQAKKDSDELTHLESVAMNAVKGMFKDRNGEYTAAGEPDRHLARTLLNGREYHLAKSKIMKSIDDFYTLLEWRTGNELNLLQHKTRAVLIAVTILTVLTILFAVFAFLLLKRRIITPLRQLKSGATLLKEGDYTHHIDVSSDDEAGDLARTFNAMADSIKERTSKLRSIIDTAIDAIIVTSKNGIIREFSPAAEVMFGYGADEVMGKNLAMLMPEPDRSRHDDYIAKYLASGEAHILGRRTETSGMRKNGQVFPISISISEAKIGGDRHFTGIIRDITERKLIEGARLFSLKLNQMADTASVEEILELGLEECVRLTKSQIGYLHFVSPDEKNVNLQIWSKQALISCETGDLPAHYPVEKAGVWCDCLRKREPVIHNDYKRLSGKKGLPKGHVPLVRDLGVPVIDNARVVAVIGVGNKLENYAAYDIDILSMLSVNIWSIVRRKRAGKLIQENEERLKLVLKGGNLGYWDVNLATRETNVNSRWAEMLGYAPEGVDNAYEIWKKSIHPEDRDTVLSAGKAYLTGQSREYAVEYRALTRAGEVRWFVSRGAVVERDAAFKPVRMVGTILDITKKKSIEQELRQNMDDLTRFSDIAIGREEKMIELKREINGLRRALGQSPKYKIVE